MVDAVIVWDLETIPDIQAIARSRRVKPQQARALQGNEFPKLPLHRIVCIGALIAVRSGRGWLVEALGAPHIGERSEEELIRSFVDRVADLKPTLVTYNGTFFDLPVLRYRAMLHSISAPGFAARNYFGRFTPDAIDLCDILSSFSNGAKVSLDLISTVLNLPGKGEGLKGADVEAFVEQGRIKEVAEYCESDVVNTYRTWLRYELFRGQLDHESWHQSERSLREFVLERAEQRPYLRRLVEQT